MMNGIRLADSEVVVQIEVAGSTCFVLTNTGRIIRSSVIAMKPEWTEVKLPYVGGRSQYNGQ